MREVNAGTCSNAYMVKLPQLISLHGTCSCCDLRAMHFNKIASTSPQLRETVLQPLGTLTARTAGERARDIGSDCKSRAAARAGAQTPTRGRSGVRGEHPMSERAPSMPERVHPVSKSVHPSLERALRVFPRPLKLKGAFSR